MSEHIIVIRIRGSKETRFEVEETLARHLHVSRKIHASVFSKPITPWLQKCKDYITWGPIDTATLTQLVEKRGGKQTKSTAAIVEEFTKGEMPIKLFRLHPPVGGFKKSTKLAFPKGELGKRDAESMKKLLLRML